MVQATRICSTSALGKLSEDKKIGRIQRPIFTLAYQQTTNNYPLIACLTAGLPKRLPATPHTYNVMRSILVNPAQNCKAV